MKGFSGELIDPVLDLSYLLIRNDIKRTPQILAVPVPESRDRVQTAELLKAPPPVGVFNFCERHRFHMAYKEACIPQDIRERNLPSIAIFQYSF